MKKIESVILRPYINGELSEDGWDIALVCDVERTPVVGLGYSTMQTMVDPPGNIVIGLFEYDFLDGQFSRGSLYNICITADGNTYEFDKCHDCTFYTRGKGYLFMTVDKDNIKINKL